MTSPLDIGGLGSLLGGIWSNTGPLAGSVGNLLNAAQDFANGAISTTGWNIDVLGSLRNFIEPIISPLPPPQLKTLVYSPEVRILISRDGSGGTIQHDVSADLIRCSVEREESSAASLFFTLHNKGLRYTPRSGRALFSRMDRVTVFMKRIGWQQVFSGYLDTIPYKQLYPGPVDFKATCTLKRIMHTWWNPTLPASLALIFQYATPFAAMSGDGQLSLDAGLGSMLRALLVTVGGWKTENVHIQNFPEQFFLFMEAQLTKNESLNAAAVDRFKHMLLGSDTTPGPGAAAGANPNAGPPGPYTADATGAGPPFYVAQIVAACDERGMGPLVSDNNVSTGMEEAGVTLGGSRDEAAQKAGQQIQQTNQDWLKANRDSDGAIIAVAVAMKETQLRNVANPNVPESLNFPNEGITTQGTGCGLFLQANTAEWGNTAQRMNPRQAAGMFFDHLGRISGWRNMDPGAVGSIVQRVSLTQEYDAFVAAATTMVQAYRTSDIGQLGTLSPGFSAPSGTSVASSALNTVGSAPSSTSNLVSAIPSSSPAPAGISNINPIRAGKPQPDSEGAINAATAYLATPYQYGGHTPGVGLDCSGLVSAAFKSIGVYVPAQTEQIAASVPQVHPNSAAQRGDIILPTIGHTGIYLGAGMWIQTGGPTGTPGSIQPIQKPLELSYGVYRACQNGGLDPTAPWNPSATMGPGTPPGALDQQGGVTSPGQTASAEGIARNMWGFQFSPQFATDVAQMWTREKVFLDGQPLIQAVKAIASAGLRQFQSAPNGDFIAYYPDYFGLDGKPAVLRLEDIELKDVRIDFSDDPLTTHVYINGDISKMGMDLGVYGWLDTAGVATVEDTWLYQRLLAMAPGDPEHASGEQIMQRFGIRPYKETYAMAGSHELELLLAMQIFLLKWSQQFQSQITITFMPELFPGMRVELASHNFQLYVSGVQHVCDFAGGFVTVLTVMAPSNPMGKALMSTVTTAAAPSVEVMRAFEQPGGL